MRLRRISHAAINQLYLEQEQFEKQAMLEIQDRHTRSLGIVRLDLIEECRRRLLFLRYMLKDAEGRAAESKLFRAKVTGPLEEFDESLGSPSASEGDPREHSRLLLTEEFEKQIRGPRVR